MAIAGGVVGLAVGVVAAIATRSSAVGSIAGHAARAALLGSAAGAGVASLANAATRGTAGEWLFEQTWGQRHQLLFAARHLLEPGVVLDGRAAFNGAQAMQRRHWGATEHGDDGVDALRHSFASANYAARLVVERGKSPDDAFATVVALGDAHEDDDLGTNPAAREMDRHNNRVGARLGADWAAQHGSVPSQDQLLAALVPRLADGTLLVVDARDTRPATLADLTPSVDGWTP